jgi:DNA-binding NarL/FixJ family response regulator
MESAATQVENDTKAKEEANILAKTHRLFGNVENGLTVDEIAELLYLQPASVKIYLRSDKRRIDLYRRLFEQDEAVKERAIGLLEARRAS